MGPIQTSGTLAALLDAQIVLPPPEALALIRSIASQVAELHASGRVHGDLECDSISLAGAGHSTAIVRPRPSGSAGTRRPAGETQFGKRRRCPQQLMDRCLGQGLADQNDRSSPAMSAAESPASDVQALAAVLCRMLTGESADAYLCSPRIKARVPESLQPLLDRILGNRSASPLANASAFLAALDAALSGGPQPARESALPAGVEAIDVEPIDVDSSCVPGIPVDEKSGVPAGTQADKVGLPFQRLGHYEILGRLGEGGMGEVYLGYERGLDRRVAIKVLPAQYARDPDLVRRFHAEATAAARLVHPNIIQIYFIGQDAGHHFFAMQYVAGMSLARLLSRRRLSIEEAVAISHEVLSGLAAAHRLSLVHRDIKPANILLDGDHRRALLADFGLVKSLEEAAREQTATGVVMGTADYMSPEQARGQHVDCRSDLYATGIVMFQMLCGRLPFPVRESSAVIYHHVHVPPPPIAEIAPQVPAPLAAVVARLLAKSPDERYPSASAALAELRAASPGDSAAACTFHGTEGDARLPVDNGSSSAGELDTSPLSAQPTQSGKLPKTRVAPTEIKFSRRQTVALLAAGTTLVAGLGAGLLHILGARDRSARVAGTGSPGSDGKPAEVRAFRDNPGDVNCFAVTSDERTLIVGDRGDKLILWDFQTGELGRTIRAHSGAIRRLILLAGDKFAVTASTDQTLKLWNTTSWKQVTQFNGHVDLVSSVVQVPGRDEIVSSSFDGRLCRWSIESGSAITWYGNEPIDPQESPRPGTVDAQSQERHVTWVRDLVIPAPGKEVISAGNDRVILIWDLESAQVVDRLIEHKGPVMCLAASRDGTRLMSGGFDKIVCLWDIPGRRLLHRIPHESATAACVAFSPDGQTAASGGADGVIHVWDVESGAERLTWQAHDVTVTSMRFLEDGERLVSGSEDHTVRLWRLPA